MFTKLTDPKCMVTAPYTLSHLKQVAPLRTFALYIVFCDFGSSKKCRGTRFKNWPMPASI